MNDKKLGVSFDNNTVDYFNPQVVSAQDYYPFGMLQPGRVFNTGGYRYGFNGKENDNEVKGVGEQQDYGMRIYNPTLGRFLSIDPLTNEYPELTPYQFASNTPIQAIDLDGAEKFVSIYYGSNNSGKEFFRTTTDINPFGIQFNGHYEMHKYPVKNKEGKTQYVPSGPWKWVADVKPKTFDLTQIGSTGNITYADYRRIGDKLGVEAEVVQAVASVESSGSGFVNGKVVIRYEGHQMKRLLAKQGFDLIKLEKQYPDLLYQYSIENNSKKPHGYKAFNAAFNINANAALQSTSYGAFQIMGFNFDAAGYKNADAFAQAQRQYANQIEAFINFVSKDPTLLKALKNKDFTTFARTYNGSQYKTNNYDTKMQNKYNEAKAENQGQ